MSRLEAAGIEPEFPHYVGLLCAGLNLSSSGQEVSQPGHSQEVASEANVELRTEPALDPHQPRTQEEHKISINLNADNASTMPVPSDLIALVEVWHELPEAIRILILDIVNISESENALADSGCPDREQGDDQ